MAFKKSGGSILANTLFQDLTLAQLVKQPTDEDYKKKLADHREQQRFNSLLPHQQKFLLDKETRHLGLVAGFGAGKSYSLTVKMLQLAYDNPGFTGIALEPTYGMLADILMPQLQDLWDEWGVNYEFFRGKAQVNVVTPTGEVSTILLRSFENYTRIRGVNAAWAVVDEIDTVRAGLATTAFRLLQGRIRAGIKPQIAVCSTPEGFGWLYNFFVEAADESKRLIRAKTTDNPFLPEDYIQSLRDQYPPALIEAYLNGEFVNLAQSTIFQDFDRVANATSEEWTHDDDIHIGLDFNIGQSHSVVAVVRQIKGMRVICCVESFVAKDTYETVAFIQRRYGHAIQRRRVFAYPDASGGNAHTSSTTTDHEILRNGLIQVVTDRRNPDLRETFAQCNLAFNRKMLMVNVDKCPELVSSLEKWSYDERGVPIKNGTPDHSHACDALRYMVWHLGHGAGRRAFRGSRVY